VVKRKGRIKTKRIQKRKLIKINPMTKNTNLVILVTFVTRIISLRNAHIEQRLQNSLKVHNNLLS